MMPSLPLALLDLAMGSPPAVASGVNFVEQAFTLSGVSTPTVRAYSPSLATLAVAAAGGTVVDRYASDLATAGHSRNGAFVLVLPASTPTTIDLTAVSAGAPACAGDSFFRTVVELVFMNLGAGDVVVTPAVTNPFPGPLGGTAPAFTVPAGASLRWHSPAGWTVSQVARALTFTPGATAALLAVSVGGT